MSNRGHLKTALTVGTFLLCMFSLFAFSFYWGTYLVLNDFPNEIKISTKGTYFTVGKPDKGDLMIDQSKYTGGDMLAVFFGVVFGVFSLATTIPNFKAIIDGKIAGYQAF